MSNNHNHNNNNNNTTSTLHGLLTQLQAQAAHFEQEESTVTLTTKVSWGHLAADGCSGQAAAVAAVATPRTTRTTTALLLAQHWKPLHEKRQKLEPHLLVGNHHHHHHNHHHHHHDDKTDHGEEEEEELPNNKTEIKQTDNQKNDNHENDEHDTENDEHDNPRNKDTADEVTETTPTLEMKPTTTTTTPTLPSTTTTTTPTKSDEAMLAALRRLQDVHHQVRLQTLPFSPNPTKLGGEERSSPTTTNHVLHYHYHRQKLHHIQRLYLFGLAQVSKLQDLRDAPDAILPGNLDD